MKDRILIYGSALLRGCAVSLSSIILAFYLSLKGLGVGWIGLYVSVGLMGSALATGMVIYLSRWMLKKHMLILISLCMTLGGVAIIFIQNSFFLFAVLFLGMINGMGRDRGASMTLEQSILPMSATHQERTNIFAWYNVLIDIGHALGSLLSFFPAFLRTHHQMSALHSYQFVWGLYSVLCALSGLVIMGLSCERHINVSKSHTALLPDSKSIIRKFAMLAGLDSFGGGFLSNTLITYWFFKHFGVDETLLGPMFFIARIANIFSHFGAAWLANRIGLIKTMVYTHVPSSLLLITIPFMPNLTVAVILFLIRESLVEMDVPTRQSYIMAVVRPEERVHASGITNLTRMTGWAVAPMVAGALSSIALSLPIIIGPSLKIIYDVLLYQAFLKIKPPEES